MPIDIKNSFISQFKSIRVVNLSVIKVFIQVTNSFSIPFTLNIYIRHYFTTLLKAPVILRDNNSTILPFIYQTIYIQLTRKSKTVFINCFSQTSIQQASSILYSSAIWRIYFIITAFITLPIVLSRAINLQVFSSKQFFFFPNCYRTGLVEFFGLVRLLPASLYQGCYCLSKQLS